MSGTFDIKRKKLIENSYFFSNEKATFVLPEYKGLIN